MFCGVFTLSIKLVAYFTFVKRANNAPKKIEKSKRNEKLNLRGKETTPPNSSFRFPQSRIQNQLYFSFCEVLHQEESLRI